MTSFFRSLQVHRTVHCRLQACLIFLLFFIASPTLFGDVYRIKNGDTLLIAVVGQPEYTHSVQVRGDGRINYFGGEFDVAGATVTTVNHLIRDFLVRDNHISNPVVMVSLVLQKNGIFVGGAVKTPGRYVISPETAIDLYRALALAGGMGENADQQGVQLIREDTTQEVETYDLSTSSPYRDIRVNINDLVFVMPLSVVEVQGQVQTPGKIFVRGAIGISHALARAGGPTQEADLTVVVKIEKSGKRSEFNLSEEFWKSPPNAEPSPMLSNGDVLFVPNFKTEPIYVTGYVRNPGPQSVRRPLNLLQAVALGGGFDVSANREEAIIYRQDGATIEVPFTFNPTEGTPQQQILLYPGDILEVKKKFQINWGIISTLAYIAVSGVSIILQLTN